MTTTQDKLSTVIAYFEHGGTLAAASALGVTGPTVRNRLMALGINLLPRGRSNLHPSQVNDMRKVSGIVLRLTDTVLDEVAQDVLVNTPPSERMPRRDRLGRFTTSPESHYTAGNLSWNIDPFAADPDADIRLFQEALVRPPMRSPRRPAPRRRRVEVEYATPSYFNPSEPSYVTEARRRLALRQLQLANSRIGDNLTVSVS